MVVSRVRKPDSGFPSRVISIVVEKFSSGKDSKSSSSEGTRARGRRMVADELKLSRVDVKERQQRFENMARSKDSKIHQTNRSQSSENPTTRLITKSRKTRSVSAEPALRSNIFKQSDQNGTPVNGAKRNGPLKKQNEFTSYKNSINVGKVANKFERQSDLNHNVVQYNRGLSPVNQSNCSKILDEYKGLRSCAQSKASNSSGGTHGQIVASKGPRSSFSPIVEDRIRKLEKGEDHKKPNSPADKSSADLQNFKHDRSVISKSIAQKHGHELSSELEASKNLAEGVCGDRGLVKDHDTSLLTGDTDLVTPAKGNIASDHNYGRSDAELRDQNERRAFIKEDPYGSIRMGEKGVFMTRYSKELDEEKDKQQVTQAGHEISHTSNAPLEQGETILTKTDEILTAPMENAESPPYEQELSQGLGRTPSMKILISNRSPKSPSNHRHAAIVRVNSRGSDKADIEPNIQSKTNRISPEFPRKIEGVGTESSPSPIISPETPKESIQMQESDSVESKIPKNRSESSGSVFEDESGYYRNVRSDLRGQRGLSPEKQHLLSRLISLENKGLANSLGFSDELLELLREEEGFWRRQVELKKWRESHESKGREDYGKNAFDPAKERKIAELRKQHDSRQIQKSTIEDGLTVDELHLAEQRLFAQEAADSQRMSGREGGEREAPGPLVNQRPIVTPINKKIYLKQRQVSVSPERFNNIVSKRDVRYSYPPPAVDVPTSGDKNVGFLKERENARSYENLPRNFQFISSENTRAPSLNTVSNGPITYFEHIANVQRNSLVAEPYASHPRRKSIGSPKTVELPPSRSDGDLRLGSRDSVFDYSKGMPVDVDIEGRVTQSRSSSQHHAADKRSPFGVATRSDSTFDYFNGDSPTEERSAFNQLRQQNNFTDPSYLSLINCKRRNGDGFLNFSEQPGGSCLVNSHDSVNQSETSIDIDHEESVNGNYQSPSEEGLDGSIRTYHVTSVAVRYAKAGPSSEGAFVKNEVIPESSSSIEEPSARPVANGSRPFSDSDSMLTSSRRDFRSLSDEVLNAEKLREAKLIVAKNTSRVRCSSCQRLINERAVMTVADSGMFWHTTCFYCVVCGIMLVKTKRGSATRVRLIADELHCITCFSQDGGQISEV